MASKKQIRQAKSLMFDEMTNVLKEDDDKNRGIITKNKINNPLETPQLVRQQYDSYIDHKRLFKSQRMNLMTAKTNLQRALDEPLYDAGLIYKKSFWSLEIDEHGTIKYKDDDQNFNVKYKKALKSFLNDRDLQEWAVDNKISFAGLNTRAPEFEKFQEAEERMDNVPTGTAGSTATGTDDSTGEDTDDSTDKPTDGEEGELPFDYKGNEQAYLKAYRALITMPEMVKFYTEKLNTKDRLEFFIDRLSDGEAKSLYGALPDEYKKELPDPNPDPNTNTPPARTRAKTLGKQKPEQTP